MPIPAEVVYGFAGTLLGAAISLVGSTISAVIHARSLRQSNEVTWRRARDKEAADAIADAYLVAMEVTPLVIDVATPRTISDHADQIRDKLEQVRRKLAFVRALHPDETVKRAAGDAMKRLTVAGTAGRTAMYTAAGTGQWDMAERDKAVAKADEATEAILRLAATVNGQDPDGVKYPAEDNV